MSEAASRRPQVNGVLETSLYVESPTRSVEFYHHVFGFEPIDLDPKEGVTDQTRLCPAIQERRDLRHKRNRGDPRRLRHFPVGTTSVGGVAVAAGDCD